MGKSRTAVAASGNTAAKHARRCRSLRHISGHPDIDISLYLGTDTGGYVREARSEPGFIFDGMFYYEIRNTPRLLLYEYCTSQQVKLIYYKLWASRSRHWHATDPEPEPGEPNESDWWGQGNHMTGNIKNPMMTKPNSSPLFSHFLFALCTFEAYMWWSGFVLRVCAGCAHWHLRPAPGRVWKLS